MLGEGFLSVCCAAWLAWVGAGAQPVAPRFQSDWLAWELAPSSPAGRHSRDGKAWDGTPWGYEGFLVDNYYTLLVLFDRNEALVRSAARPAVSGGKKKKNAPRSGRRPPRARRNRVDR